MTIDLDFSNILDYPPENYRGIIVVRYASKDESAIDEALHQALRDLYREGLRDKLVVISAGKYRVRHGQK